VNKGSQRLAQILAAFVSSKRIGFPVIFVYFWQLLLLRFYFCAFSRLFIFFAFFGGYSSSLKVRTSLAVP
jgi:hypothetical protein